MEKIGSTLVHLEPGQLRTHFTKLLDQALPSPSSAGAPPPAAIMHVVSEKDSAVLLYRNLAVKNKVGIATAAELFEFHLLVAEDLEDPNLVTLRTLSDDDAKRLCGADYLNSVEAKRERVDLRKLKRVQVDGKITLEAADFGCTKLLIAASVLLTSGVDRAASSHERNNGKLLRLELDIPGTWSKFMVASTKMPGGISNRVFANWWTWAKEQNGDIVAAFTPHEDFGPGAEKEIVDAALEAEKGSVLGKIQGFYRIKTLAPNVCRATFVAQGDAGGTIGKQAMAWGIKSTLGMVTLLQDNVVIGKAKATLDCSAKEAFAYQIAVCGREKMRIGMEEGDCARFIFKEHAKHDFEWAQIKKMPFPLTNREFLGRYLSFKKPSGDLVLVFEALPDSTKVDYGANLKVVRGKITGVVRFKPIDEDSQCEVTLVQRGDAGGFVPERVSVAKIPQALGSIVDAPITEVAAWELAKMSRENRKEHVTFGGLDRNLKKINDHQNIYHVVYDLSIPTFLPRQFVSRVVWKWDEDKKELKAYYDDVTHEAFPERNAPEEVLAHVWDTEARNKTSPDDLEKEIDEKPNDHNQLVFNKKHTPAVIANRDFLGRVVWKKAEEVTYPNEKNKKTPSEAVAHIVKLHKGLSELSQEYPWIVAFLEEVLLGGLHRNKAVSTKLDCLSEAEARKIGKNLPGALRARKQASGGVYQWKNQNPSMVELFEKYPWVEEMVETMGEELLKNAAWGLWFRVITGSGLSMVDMATDINVIRVYFGEEGQEGYGWMMLGMVLASMGLQLVVVMLQNGKAGWGKLLREVLIVVSGLKPGVDAMRVVSNTEMHEHHAMDAKAELVANKMCEMFCESIPGCILQVYALIQGGSGGKMRTKVFSIVVSAITTGMSSASISYDFDSDPDNRRRLPSFYGYLPDEGNARTIMYVCMVLNSALLLLLRSIGAALLMLADTKVFVAYMAGDQLLYLLLKLGGR
ncbi:hypothetical protein TeGR_g14713 [Tetraparma gracilis]|uniref:Uncharacterized protein n=1 Tax=Tetraparma gracilis TaxID=2962635 RepID=A0ABQ6NAF7_9STRA|nr:hypothetical protein TeGR_g14713 [Tetraparma gracilis]